MASGLCKSCHHNGTSVSLVHAAIFRYISDDIEFSSSDGRLYFRSRPVICETQLDDPCSLNAKLVCDKLFDLGRKLGVCICFYNSPNTDGRSYG